MTATVIEFSRDNARRSLRYTKALAQEICLAIIHSDMDLTELCEKHKKWPSKEKIFEWLTQHEEFQQAFDLAKELQVDNLMDQLISLPSKVLMFTDELGNRRIHPLTLQLMEFETEELKRKIDYLMP